MPASDLDTLLQQRDQLKSQLASIGDMRPGSLVARFRKCGKPSCGAPRKVPRDAGPVLLADACSEGQDRHQRDSGGIGS
jgi:hypothetical protein